MLVSSLETVLRAMADNLGADMSALKSNQSDNRAGAGSPDVQHPAIDRLETTLILKFLAAYGSDKILISRKMARLADQCQSFTRRFGDGPVRVLRAPARINILGEHIDYVSYLPTSSLTFGSRQHDMVIMFRPAPTGLLHGVSTDARFEDFEFEMSGGPPGPANVALESEWLQYLYSRQAPAPGWANYVIGACRFAQMKYGSRVSAGFDFLIDSSVPAGGGASSSSALSVLSGAAIRIVNGISYEPAELAMDSSRAEWYIGTRGGSMDHTTILMARPDQAISISYLDNSSTMLPLPSSGYSWITFFTQPAIKGQDVMNEYNERAFVSRILIPAILEDWQSTNSRVSGMFAAGVSLLKTGDIAGLSSIQSALSALPEFVGRGQVRERYPAAWDKCSKAFPSLIASSPERDFAVRKRALHHVGEVNRVIRARQILNSLEARVAGEPASAEKPMTELGRLLYESHSSLHGLYEVSTHEIEELIQIIQDSHLPCGARMMGGGFGGNILALAPHAACAALIDVAQEKYYLPRKRDGVREGSIMVSTAGLGISQIA